MVAARRNRGMPVHDTQSQAGMEPVVRGLTAAAKALRLYPPTSPIPRQAVESAQAALASFLTSEPVLCFKVVRDGLAWNGATVAPGAPGATELADALRDHGVAEIDFLPGVSADDIIAVLSAALEKPETLLERGGIAAVLTSAGVETVRTAEISLTVVDPWAVSGVDEGAEEFLRELAGDPDRVSAWLGVASQGDPATLSAGLADLATAAGDGNLQTLVASLSSAFEGQGLEVRDALVGVSLDDGPARDIMGKVFSRVGTADLAKTLCGGTYGHNMLSMSSALSRLPLAERMTSVLAQVKELLPDAGHTAKELDFLEHMIEVRRSGGGEATLAEAQPLYKRVAELTRVDASAIDEARGDVAGSAGRADESAVSTMLTLLDQQEDFGLYRRTLDALAGMVAPLLERGRLDLSARIVGEIAARESRSIQPWPELAETLRGTMGEATGRRTMKALLSALAADPAGLTEAREIVQRASDAGAAAFIEEALSRKPDGLDIAEKIAGRRVVDMLSAAAAHAQWFHVAQLVERLGRESDPRSQQAVEALLKRPDDQSRREAAAGLARAGGPAALRHLGALMRDPSAEVAIAAVRAVGHSSTPGAAALLAARLGELDIDGKDFALARELIGALARTHDSGAAEALEALASRRALIKRGHFAEIQELARQAVAERSKGAGR